SRNALGKRNRRLWAPFSLVGAHPRRRRLGGRARGASKRAQGAGMHLLAGWRDPCASCATSPGNHGYLPFPRAPDGISLRGGGGRPPAFLDGPRCPLRTQSTPTLGPCPMRRPAIGWIVSRPPPGGPICG